MNKRVNNALRIIVQGYLDLGYDIGIRRPLTIHRDNRMKVYENGVFKDADIEYIDITSKPALDTIPDSVIVRG